MKLSDCKVGMRVETGVEEEYWSGMVATIRDVDTEEGEVAVQFHGDESPSYFYPWELRPIKNMKKGKKARKA